MKSWWPATALVIPLAIEAGLIEFVAGVLVVGAVAVLFERLPTVALSILVGAAAVSAVVFSPLARAWPVLALIVFSYLAGRRVAVFSLLPVLAVLPVSLVAKGLAAGLYDWFVSALVISVAMVLPWLAGRLRRQRAEILAAGWERAALLERQRELEIGRERARIARDMHDSLGHEWSLIALRAAAMELTKDPRKQQELAGQLRADVAHATERLHEIIVMLDDANRSVGVAGLIERARAAGMRIDAPDDLPDLTYRVVQEGLTNAAKHAPGADVTIRCETNEADTTVTITNGPGDVTVQPSRDGTGLARLREHMPLRAGPEGGGFELVATIPHTALPAARSAARRGVATALRVPAIATGVLVVLTGCLYFAVGANNELAPDAFERLTIGAPQADVERQLPAFEILGEPDRALTTPEGAECQRYWATEQQDDRLYYRLCFIDGRLAVKQTLPRKDVP